MSKWVIPPAVSNDIYFNRIRELELEADKRIKNQHVVSKVILKGFAAPGPRGQGWQLTPFNLRLGHEQRPRGLRGCGRVPDFLTFASESAEQLWKCVEDQLHNAIQAARAGKLHDQSAYAETITDCIALHLVRSIRYLALHQSISTNIIERVRKDALHSRRAMLEAEFRRRYGLEAAGPEALGIILEEPIAKWRALDDRGALARTSMEQMFSRMRETLRGHAVEVWHVPHGRELLISDSPAVTFRYLAQGTTIEPNVAVGDSHCIALPLAKDCMVAIGAVPKDDELLPDKVSFFNRLQVAVGFRYVYYHPASGLKEFVQATLKDERLMVPACPSPRL